MLKHLLKRTMLLCAVVLAGVNVSAEDYTYDFSNSMPGGWTSSVSPFGFETTNQARGCQFTSDAVLTLSGAKNVSKIVITCSANTDKNGLAVSVAGTKWGDETLAKGANMVKTFSGTTASGDVVVSITRVEKSVYISKIVVTADESSTDGGDGDENVETVLDEDYEYAEPTEVTVSGQTSSNAPYSFVKNNIMVECSAGAQTDSYFGCNAGNDITFTATKPIKAIVIDGYVKKDFEASASSGKIGYVDASVSEVTANPVLAVTDVDSKSVTLSCVKQLRCYKVSVYFDSNFSTEFDFSGGDDDDDDDDFGELNYSYEPTTASSLNITFDEVYEQDMSADYGFNIVDLYFVSEDYEMEIYVFAPKDAQCGVAPGTYPINSTYEDGTVQASPGGDDYYDYPAYIATDFEYDEDWGWYYNSTYYLISGSLKVEKSGAGVKYTLDAKSYYGSTIKASFTGTLQSLDEEEDAIESVTQQKTSPVKLMKDGQIVIQRNGSTYTTSGTRIK